MLLPTHRCLVVFDTDSAVVEAANAAVFITNSTQLLNNGSDITASDEVLSFSRVYKRSMERFRAS